MRLLNCCIGDEVSIIIYLYSGGLRVPEEHFLSSTSISEDQMVELAMDMTSEEIDYVEAGRVKNVIGEIFRAINERMSHAVHFD